MNNAGLIVFCFAVAGTLALLLSESHRLVFWLIGGGVVGLSVLGFATQRFWRGHRLPLYLLMISIAVLTLLLSPI